MTNLFDYIIWRGDLSFKHSKLNKIDCLLFSQIIMLDFDDIIPHYGSDNHIRLVDAREKYNEKHGKDKKIGLIIPLTIVEAFYEMSFHDRYKHIQLSDYINFIDEETHCQFCGLTVTINEHMRIIVFSGTDDTIAGWKENFSLVYKDYVEAHLKAIEYVETIIQKYGGKFILCGHSKGGHLAMYSALKINDNAFDAVIKAFNFDGQGIDEKKDIYNKERLEKITAYLPSGAVIGRLFDHPEKQRLVHSECITLYQHDVFSWEIMGNNFVYEKQFLKDCDEIDKQIKKVLSEMDFESRKKFVETLGQVLDATGAKTLSDLSTRKMALLSSYFKVDKNNRKYISEPIKKLFKNKALQSYFLKTLKESKKYKN